jgi:DNA-binding PadR family transcriptional regulator
MHKKLEERKINIGIGRLYSILAEMKTEGFLNDRWEKSQSGPRRRVYRTAKKGVQERQRILVEAIKTVHDFYMEYILNLPPELSAFNIVLDRLAGKLPKNANMAYATTRFSGPVKKVMDGLQEKVPEGDLHAIHPRKKDVDLGMDNVTIVGGTFEDIPMKDNFLDLLVVTGSVSRDSLDACLSEWQRVVNVNGTLALVTPTILLVKPKDPLDIGDFVEEIEHPRADTEDSLDLEIITKKMKKYFGKVDVKKVVHISVFRGLNPLK